MSREEVLIEIKSIQKVGDQEENVDVIARGFHTSENGEHLLEYDEFDNETDDKTENTIRFTENKAEVVRKGNMTGNLTFEKGEKNETIYSTPFGDLNMDIITNDIQIDEKDKQIVLKIAYELYDQNEKVSDHTINVSIKK